MQPFGALPVFSPDSVPRSAVLLTLPDHIRFTSSFSLFSAVFSSDGSNRVDVPSDRKNYRGKSRPGFSSQELHSCSKDRSGMGNAALPNFMDKMIGEGLQTQNTRTPKTVTRIGINSDSERHEKLWRDLMADPSMWWDNRPGKDNPKTPDFKHKQTGEALWLDNRRTPAWVPSEVIARFGSEGEKLDKFWRDFFADPSKWWNNRTGKENSKFPDFKHKQTGEVLWVDSELTPAWVRQEIGALKIDHNDMPWQDLFLQPSQWWDHRSRKRNPRSPDFIHKRTGEGLWLDGRQTPPWVASKLACLGSGTLQSDVVSRIDKLSRCNKARHFSTTMKHFEQMQQEGISADCYIFVRVLQACAALGVLNEGRRIHALIVDSGWEFHPHVCSSLVDMYAKCGNIEEARTVFHKMPTRDVVSWNAMIMGSVKCGRGQDALELFQQMQLEGIQPTSVTFVSLLNASASVAALDEGRRVHQMIIRSGYEANSHIGNSLVDMYAKCGSIEDALKVFERMPSRDLVSWNAMIMGYVKCGQGREALELFQRMQLEIVEPDFITFAALLNACASIPALDEGRRVHQMIIRTGFESDVYVDTSLVDMYAKCGSIDDALRVFEKMPTRNLVSWNAMILGCVKCSKGQEALELFQQMLLEKVEPDSITFLALIDACGSIAALEEGRRVHQMIFESGCESDLYVSNSLVDMYSKCGSIGDARKVFDKMIIRDLATWNAMILGYVMCGQSQEALELFKQMQHERVHPSSVTFLALLNSCASIAALEEGRRVHEMIILSGYESDLHVGCSLVDMYVKCGSIEDALRVFDNMPIRNLVAWNVMIQGCSKSGNAHEALRLFKQMEREKVQPDSVTFVALLNACASIAALEEGRRLHQIISCSGYEFDEYVGNSLVDMYAKCGSIENALKVFQKMPTRDVVSWNSMMMGFSLHGLAKEAVELFEEMSHSGSEINEITFICLLSACSHGGLVKEGRQYFECMWSVYGVTPTHEHYTIMVDILGRAGHLALAEEVIEKMPLEPCAATWKSLLASCRIHGNVEIGERASKRILQLDPTSSAGYVLLSNIYAAAGN